MSRVKKNFSGERFEGYSSFFSAEKDLQTILKRLFNIEGYSDYLKRLLLIPEKDCIRDIKNEEYFELIDAASISSLLSNEVVRLKPKLIMEDENNEIKNFLIFTFDNFVPNAENPLYRDCTIMVDVICHIDCWDIEDFYDGNSYLAVRPLKIAGFIDGMLDKSRLSGIGTLQFMGCSELVLNDNFAGYTLIYSATHTAEDFERHTGNDFENVEQGWNQDNIQEWYTDDNA